MTGSARKPVPASRGIAVVATAVLIAAAGLVAVTSDQGLVGTLEVAHADDFVTQPVAYHWLREDNGHRTRLHFHDHGPTGGGQRVRIKGPHLAAATDGAGSGDVIDVQSLEVLAQPVASLEAAVTAKRIALLLVNFSNDPSQPVTPAAAAGVLVGNPGSVVNFYTQEARGAATFFGQVFGWYTLPTTNAGCSWSSWGSMAQTAAAAAGVDLSGFTQVVTLWPFTSGCPWAGLGYVPGRWAYINGNPSLRTMAHELGHNFGVMHASALSCTSGGVRVALSGTCTYSEYGDPFTVMGSGFTFHHDALAIGELGWLGVGEAQVVSGSGDYSLTPLLDAGPVKLLRIVRPNGTSLYVDFRVPHGTFDCFSACSNSPGGVMVRTSPDSPVFGSGPTNSMLVDATPGSVTFSDAPLAVGQSLADPVSGVTLTTVSAGPSAVVRVTMPGGPVPTPSPTTQPTPSVSPTPTATVPPTASPSVSPTPSGSGGAAYLGVVGTASRSTSGNGSLTITATRPVTGTVVVALHTSTVKGTVACSDSRGEPWTVDAERSGTSRLVVCSARGVALAAGDTITVTYPAFSGVTLATATNWQGSLTAYSVHSASGNSAVPNTGAVAGQPGDLIVGAVAYTSTPTFTAACGGALATEAAAASGSNRKAIDVTWQVAGSYSACGTLSFGRPWQAIGVAYR